jgi:DamX protein
MAEAMAEDGLPLEEQPDAIREDYFSTPELTQRLDLLRHLTDNSERIPLITGAEGSGKSEFLRRYLQRARMEWAVCHIEADPMLQPDQFFSRLYRCFHLIEERLQSVEYLVRHFGHLQSEGRMAVIVVDDAHLLPMATINELLMLHERHGGKAATVRIVLFASPEITGQLESARLNMAALQFLDLPVFSREQVAAFVAHLAGAGAGAPAVGLNEAKIERLFRDGQGNPGSTARLYREMSGDIGDDGIPPELHPSKRRALLTDLPGAALAGILFLVVLAVITLIFQDQINALFEGEGSQSVESRRPMAEEAVVELKLPESNEEIVPLAEVQPEGEREMTQPPDPVDVSLPEVAPEDEVQGQVDELARFGLTEIRSPAADSARLDAPKPAEISAPDGKAPLPEKQAEPPRQKVVEVEKPAEDEPVSGVVKEPPPVRDAGSGFKGEVWLLQQNPKHYTLQLIGVGNEQAAHQFIDRYRLGDKAAYFKGMRNGVAWFSVVYGAYPSRDLAVSSRGRLPPELARGDAWPRTFASVQQAIRSR